MNDQASALRQLMVERPRRHADAAGPTNNVIAIGSGKGGVGKSVMAALTGATLADAGYRVLLVDGDQNMANLHVLLGVTPVARVETLMSGGTPADLIVPIRDGLWLLPGDSGSENMYGMGGVERARLFHRLSSVFGDYDLVVVDGAAGIEGVVRACTMTASRLVMVTVPEPAALTDAYAVIKMASLQAPDIPIHVLVNRVEHEHEGEAAFDRLQTAANRFLQRSLGFLGAVPEDEAVRTAVRGASPILDAAGLGKAGAALRRSLTKLDLPPSLEPSGAPQPA